VEVKTTFTGFADRTEAGHERGRPTPSSSDCCVGGVVTTATIADASICSTCSRKLGTPGQDELHRELMSIA